MSDCIFCKILAGEIPSKKVYEDEDCIAMLDIGPANPGHALVIPREHFRDITEMEDGLLGKLMHVAAKIGMRQMEVLGAEGFNIVQNNGAAAGQTVLHFHIHVIPRYKEDPQMVAWEPKEISGDELERIKNLMVAEA